MIKGKILFVYTNKSSFIKSDVSILRENFTVREYCVINKTPLILSLSLLKLFFYLIFNIYKFRFLYIWFADYHSFLPVLAGKITGKKTVLVAGGYDVCREKKYNYGSFVKPLRAYMALYSIKYASHCLAVSENIFRIIKKIAPTSNCSVLYNGVSLPSSLFNGQSFSKKENSVLCVSLVNSRQAFYIKGVDRFIETASHLKDVKFILVGTDKDLIGSIVGETPSNLEIAGKVEHSLLFEYYSSSKVYCQLSRRESFCLALAESMLFNCFPVISNVGGMPEVVGNYGIIVNDYNPAFIATAISVALAKEKSESILQERILKNFTIDIRKQKLLQLLSK
jgi:glycosyltransferase involved in cell wall biosynthesis